MTGSAPGGWGNCQTEKDERENSINKAKSWYFEKFNKFNI